MSNVVFAGPDPDRNLERSLKLGPYVERAADDAPPPVVEGVLRRTIGLAMEADGCHAALGGRCDVVAADGRRVETEVVGFANERLYLMPVGDMRGIVPNARVIPVSEAPEVPVGDALLGRILDGRGRPLDGGAPIVASESVPLMGESINPLERPRSPTNPTTTTSASVLRVIMLSNMLLPTPLPANRPRR